jgi:choline kinase
VRAIIIGAGRGQRLMPATSSAPKCFTEVNGKRILDRIVSALREGGVSEICFIGGYFIDAVKRDYPDFIFRHNPDWADNNILASLMYAEDLMDRPFISSYADILYTPEIVGRLNASPADFALGVDTDWLSRYDHRSQHPPDDAEKVTVSGGRVTRVHRAIPTDEAHGEFIGVAKYSADGARLLRQHYHRARSAFAGKPFREAARFEKAYLIHLLQDMIEHGVEMTHEDMDGGYFEIDTLEDLALAERTWP